MTEIEGAAATKGFRVGRAALAPQDRGVPAAAILDLARTLGRQPEFEGLGGELLLVAGTAISASGPVRRVLVGQIVDVVARVAEHRTILVFEDLQWADELTLEILSDLARRSREVPLLLLGAFRSDEMTRGSALREWRARLVTQRIAEDVRLARLDRDETALMTTLILDTGLPAPRDVAEAIYARTDGVPLHVEELLGALDGEAMDGGAIHARRARIPRGRDPAARRPAVVGCAGGGPRRVRHRSPVRAVGPCRDHGRAGRRARRADPGAGRPRCPGRTRLRGLYDFRHQLLRDALYRTVPARDRRRFHARAAEFGARLEGASEIHASVHYEQAGMHDEAFRAALGGARAAVRLSSHREAFELYRRAAENMPPDLAAWERSTILLEYATAATWFDRNNLVADLASRAREEALAVGDALTAAEALLLATAALRREGLPIPDRRDAARRVLVELERLPSSDRRDLQRINALEELVRAEIDALRLGDARGYLLEARAIAVGAQWDGERLWLDDLTARIDVIEGRVDEGVATIRAVAESARAGGEEEGAVWAYRDATLMAIRGLAFAEAGRFLEQGLDYAEAREHSHCGHIMASATALVAWAEGRWSEAVERGQHALVDEGSARARSIAQCALGFTAMGRGERRTATAHLEPAAELARRAGWLEVYLPAVWGMAEAALADGDAPAAIRQCEEALTFGRNAGEWALLGPFAVTGVRSYQVAGRPDAAARWLDQVIRAVGPVRHVVEPAIDHATGLVRLADGSVVLARKSFEAAIRGWDARGRRWEGLWARLDLASALLRSNRYAAGMDLRATRAHRGGADGQRPSRDPRGPAGPIGPRSRRGRRSLAPAHDARVRGGPLHRRRDDQRGDRRDPRDLPQDGRLARRAHPGQARRHASRRDRNVGHGHHAGDASRHRTDHRPCDGRPAPALTRLAPGRATRARAVPRRRPVSDGSGTLGR